MCDQQIISNNFVVDCENKNSRHVYIIAHDAFTKKTKKQNIRITNASKFIANKLNANLSSLKKKRRR